MSVTLTFSTGRVVTREDAADTHYNGAVLKLVTKDGKELFAYDAADVVSVTINGKKIDWPPRP